jgi:hypothetical protein
MKTKPSDQDIANIDNSFLQAITRDIKTHLRMSVNTDKLQIQPLFKKLVKGVADKLARKDSETIRKEWFITNYTPLTEEQHRFFILFLSFFISFETEKFSKQPIGYIQS